MQIAPPGSTIGIIGGGQLGLMFAREAVRMGYRVKAYCPEQSCPVSRSAELHQGEYEDLDEIRAFASSVQAVTYEFENIPATTVDTLAETVRVCPNSEVLRVSQNRVQEKQFFARIGVKTCEFATISSREQIAPLSHEFVSNAVAKTTRFGYDGKGQIRVRSHDELTSAWDSLNTDEIIVEEFVSFVHELSVIGVRADNGAFVCYGPILNQHARHILDISSCPADLPSNTKDEAHEITRAVMESLSMTGVLCVEMFLTEDNRLLANEIAPRPHNSGHLTIESHASSQFEQQLRALCGLPLGSSEQRSPAAMANLLGDLWVDSEPHWKQVLKDSHTYLHLYGKAVPRTGRKMGHLTALDSTAAAACMRVEALRARLSYG